MLETSIEDSQSLQGCHCLLSVLPISGIVEAGDNGTVEAFLEQACDMWRISSVGEAMPAG